jgi:outer membrane protein assembly factor BamB
MKRALKPDGCTIALAAALLFTISCAALMNSDRPSYSGPIAKPLWHNATMKVEKQPFIYNGVVYAIGSPFEGPGQARLYALDLKDGKQLWTTDFDVKSVLLGIGQILYVQDEVSHTHTVNTHTGAEYAPPDTISFSKGIFIDGVAYLASGDRLYTHTGAGPKPLWESSAPSAILSTPAVAGDKVYALATEKADFVPTQKGKIGIYAFDRRTGAQKWKWELANRTDQYVPQDLSADEHGAYFWMADKGKDIFGKGVLIALDASTGQERWRQTTSMFAMFTGAPLLFEPNVVVIPTYPGGNDPNANSSGFLYQAFDRATGVKVWESKSSWKYEGAVTYKNLLLASDHKVHQVLTENNNTSPDSWVSVVDLRTGKELVRTETVSLGVFTQPASGEGTFVVGSKPFIFNDIKGSVSVAGVWAYALPH